MAQGDPFKTLFVARISYEATERKLRREFEEFGPIKSIRLVHERNSGQPFVCSSLQLAAMIYILADVMGLTWLHHVNAKQHCLDATRSSVGDVCLGIMNMTL